MDFLEHIFESYVIGFHIHQLVMVVGELLVKIGLRRLAGVPVWPETTFHLPI